LSLLYPYSNQVLANGRGAGLLRRDEKGCWGRKRLRNAALDQALQRHNSPADWAREVF